MLPKCLRPEQLQFINYMGRGQFRGSEPRIVRTHGSRVARHVWCDLGGARTVARVWRLHVLGVRSWPSVKPMCEL